MNQKIKKMSLIAWIAIGSFVSVQISSAQQETFYIKGVRFANPLLEKWISEYAKARPDVSLSIADKNSHAHAIEVVTDDVPEDENGQTKATVIAFGKYAVLPIAGKDHVLLDEFEKKKLNEKRLKELFFEKDLLADNEEPDKKNKYDVTVYSGTHTSSVSHSFSEHFGYEAGSLKGKKIAGDDIYLNSAVKKDVKGISFNNLSYVFDLESRQLHGDIALLPLDVKKEYAEVLKTQNLDETIALLENKSIDLIPVEDIAFVLPENVHPVILQFLEWALSEGQAYVRSFGFLRLDAKTLAQQQKQVAALETKLLAGK
ncbi:MAG: hypothetical protein LBD27_08330 [Tannerella sp.]|jgi:ABC-type phosphate transport system substrate-binding protein|nr:hypothetical protein [Tannerella sp.]